MTDSSTADERPLELTLPPGAVWTAKGHFAVDALRLRLQWNGTHEVQPAVVSASIIEVHELNVLDRRHRSEMRFAVRRALVALLREGLCFFWRDQVYTVRPGRLRIDPGLRFRLYVLDDAQPGPFPPLAPKRPNE